MSHAVDFVVAPEIAQGLSHAVNFAVAPEVAQGFSLGSHRVPEKFGALAPGVCSLPNHHKVGEFREDPEAGFALIALVVAIFVILLFLSVAAPKVARDLRREKELESIQRGNQYVRAIQLYYKKLGHYPGSMDQLEKTNNIRFLRQQYIDPMTGKPDWRIILVGQNKTTVKGLFGQPLAGIAAAGIGSGIAGTSTPGTSIGGTGSSFGGTGSSFGGTSNNTANGASAGITFGLSGSTPGAASGSSTGSAFGATPASTGSTGIGSQSATDFKGAAGPFMGIGHNFSGDSIVTLNEQTDYSTWEFIYDPRIEQLKAKSNLFGGGAATSATSPALGSSFGNGSGTGNGASPTTPAAPGSSFGSPTSSPTTPTPAPQP